MGISIYDPSSQIKSMNQSRKAAAITGLKGAYDNSMNTYNQQDSKIDPKAYKDRGTASTSSQLGTKNFAEYLANRGQSSSGFGNQSELNRGMQLQSDVGGINLQAKNEHTDINNNKSSLTNTFNTNKASSNASIEAEGQQQLIDAQSNMNSQKIAQENADRAYKYQQEQFAYQKQQDSIANAARAAAARASASRSSGGSSRKSSSKSSKPTSGANTGIKNIDDAVNGSYKVGEKIDMLKGYASELANQTGTNAAYLRAYVQQGIKKVEAARSQFVNVDRYNGAMDYYATHAQ